MARSLRAGTDTAVGMVVESVADPFFSAMVAAVEKAESTHGKSVLVASTHGDAARERDVVAQMLSRRICGMLLAPTTGDHAWLHTTTPLVQVDRAAPGLDADVVGIDDEAAAADAVDHLVARGHRRIGYISDHPLVPTSRARWPGTGAPWPPTRSTSTHGWYASSARTRRQRRQLHEIFWRATILIHRLHSSVRPPGARSASCRRYTPSAGQTWRWSASATSQWRTCCNPGSRSWTTRPRRSAQRPPHGWPSESRNPTCPRRSSTCRFG